MARAFPEAATVIYLRVDDVQLGLDARTAPLLDAVQLVETDRADVDLGRQFRFAPQPCPACGVQDHPASLVGGFPSPELLLAAHVGEVAFADGGTVDRRSRHNARCRHCNHDFKAT